MRRVACALAAVTALAGLAACSASSARAPRPSLITELKVGSEVSSPARWHYHPSQPDQLLRELQLPDGERLLVGDSGERWLTHPGSKFAKSSSILAPEALIEVSALQPEGWLFVGESGTTYETREPLGPFLRVQRPPEPLVEVTASGRSVLGVTRRGGLLRSTDGGTTWAELELSGFFADVALLPSGYGLALLSPEGLLATEDGGIGWQPMAVAPFGVVRLQSNDTQILLESFLGSRIYAPDSSPQWAAKQQLEPLELRARVQGGPDADALTEGRAVLRDQSGALQYVELRAGQDANWLVVAGEQLGPHRVVSQLKAECAKTKLAVSPTAWTVACFDEDDALTTVRFYASREEGKGWSRLPFTARADFERFRWTALADGSLVVSGICPRMFSGPGCKPEGIHRTRELPPDPDHADPHLDLVPVATPALLGPALQLAALPGGQRVIAIGARTKGDALGVFMSDSGVNRFAASEVQQLELAPRGGQAEPTLEVEQLGVGDDGHVALVIMDNVASRRLIAVLEEDGRFVGLNGVPAGGVLVSSWGLRALAVLPGAGEVWESVDGGASWQPVGSLPGGACAKDAEDCHLYCHRLGCVVGKALSRIGWQGQEDSGVVSVLSEASSELPPTKRLRTPISCKVEDGQPWDRLAVPEPPGVAEAAIGDTAWYVLEVDQKSGAVEMAEARGGGLQRAELFPASPTPRDTALHTSSQIEGALALRQVGSAPVQVAWRNLFEGAATRRARFAAGVAVNRRPSAHPTQLALPVGVSIASGGVFALLGPRPEQRMFFGNDGTQKRVGEAAWPHTIAKGRDEYVRVEGQSLSIRLLGRGLGASRAIREVDGWKTDAMAVGLLRSPAFGETQVHNIAYSGDRVGYLLMQFRNDVSQAKLFPFQASGPVFGEPIAVPTQASLPATPIACSRGHRASSPRVVTAPEPATRHPVLVTDSVELLPAMLTRGAVLHGTPEEPCVASFDAQPVERSETEGASAIIDLAPGASSWVFKAGAHRTIQFRKMTCAFDPGAPVPPSVSATLQ